MGRQIIEQVVARALSDAAFRRLLQENPRAALRGFTLSPDEVSALTSGDPAKLTAFGVDQRMSRMLAASDHLMRASVIEPNDAAGGVGAADEAVSGATTDLAAGAEPGGLSGGIDAGDIGAGDTEIAP